MPVIFRDAKTDQILRIDLGNPDSEIYASMEELKNWKAEIVDEKTAADLILATFPQPSPEPWTDPKKAFENAKTTDEKILILAKKTGLI